MSRAGRLALTGTLGAVLVGSFPATASAGPSNGFEVTGVPVQAIQAGDAETAATLATTVTAGRYRFDLAADDSMRWVAVERTPGTSLWITMVTRFGSDTGYEDEPRIEVATPDGEDCGSDDVRVSSEDGYRGPVPVGVLIDAATVDEDCFSAGRLLVGMARDPDPAGDELPAELNVLEEPQVSDVATLPDRLAHDEDPFEPAWSEAGEPAGVSGAVSFPAAPDVVDGRYSDRIAPGGVRLYRVDAGFGQRVTTVLHASAIAAGDAAHLPDGLEIEVAVFGPGRRLLARDTGSLSEDSGVTVGAATPTLRYRNRESTDDTVEAASLAGPHYVLVTARAADTSSTFSYQFDIRVDGDVTGRPAYTGAGAPDDPKRVSPAGGAVWPIAGPLLVGVASAAAVGGIGLALRRRD